MDSSGGRVFTVSESRLPMYCTYSSRPDGYLSSSSPSTSISYLPSTTQSRMVQCAGDPFISNSRLMVLPPRLRKVYADLDLDDDDEDPDDTYVSPTINRTATQRVDKYLDEIMTPQMNELESETQKIRRDAQAVLQRLGESSKKKPTRLSSVYFPDLAYTSTSSSYTPRTTSYNYPTASSSSSSRYERAVTPIDYDDDLYSSRTSRRPMSYSSSYTAGAGISRPLKHDPIAQVQSEINRKSLYSENCRKINDSVKTNWTPKKQKKHYPDADEVKNNINFRAQYASMRKAAEIGVKKNNDYLMV